ncbi:cytochrome c oxidase subunit II [Nitrosovibrio tenuis]|uniref:Cytochrome aa3 subunit 2 n=1 Tax=Nitrosovibrio tenuis TaxID=1233 RepID=A0A1H7N169_9PROT|nr:cytochrome c oxidase subunit II [Nitrosovibrio tenuis]SEL17071.1 cytochrome c oxidase subunit 2 [Nitrosovibrio tenuis]
MHDEPYASAFAIKTNLEAGYTYTDGTFDLAFTLAPRSVAAATSSSNSVETAVRACQSMNPPPPESLDECGEARPWPGSTLTGGRGFGAAVAGLTAVPGACMAETLDAPLNYFLHSYGPAARPTMYLGWVLVGVCAAVCFIIAVLLIMAVRRKRPAADPRAIGREGEGLEWLYIGTGISTLVLIGLVVYSLMVLNAVAKPPEAPTVTLTVTGYDWWWKVEYEHSDPAQRFITANEVHIPVGQPVLIKLKSADVIHAFWVPTLAGKTQMIPGLMNQKWIQADAPGTYTGQCAQYCGAGHAHMGFEVIAEDIQEFEKWRDTQRRPASLLPSVSNEDPGYKLFMDRCAGCHAIRGTKARGTHGPDLTHLKSRRRLAAGLLTNTPDHLMDWIIHAQQFKPGSRMPSISLSEAESSALATFLSKLD